MPDLPSASGPNAPGGHPPSAPGWKPLEPSELGRLLPGYEILSLLGRGGMGAVYYAVEKSLDRPVALKLLPAELSAQPGFADRFTREARAMAKLSHPNIIALHEFGHTSAGHLFFTMEFVEGSTLAAMIHGPGLNPDQALVLSSQICLALAYAHEQGVVHRDMKPANVLVTKDGQVKIADFGLARLLDPSEVALGHTVTGQVMGTPDYMAPEQKRGMSVDHRADIYSLGVMLYEMLCRQVPLGAFAPPSQVVKCDAGLDRIVERAMQPAPERRYQSTTAMKVDVDQARAAPPRMVKRAPWKWAAVAGLALTMIVLAVVWKAGALNREARNSGVPATPVKTRVTYSVPGTTATNHAASASVEASNDHRAAEWLVSRGGTVGVGTQAGWREYSAVEQLPEGEFQLRSMTLDAFGKPGFGQPRAEDYQALSAVSGLSHAWFRMMDVTDDALAFLRNNRGLRHLQLHGLNRITDATLEHLAQVPVQKLDIVRCRGLHSDGLARFVRRESIKELSFVGQDLDDRGLATLCEFSNVEFLNVYNNPITDEGVRSIAALPKLARLYLYHCPEVTGTAFTNFTRSSRLEIINIRDSGVTEAGCAALAGLTTLRELNLSRHLPIPRPPLSDAGLAHLARLTNLHTLIIAGARVTPEGLRAFQKAVPGCDVRLKE